MSDFDEQYSLFPIASGTNVAHTLGHIQCPACERTRAGLIGSITSKTEFCEAGRLWLESRSVRALPGAISARYIRQNTEDSYKQYIGTLGLFFAGHLLGNIHIGHLPEYQVRRLTGAEPFIRFRRPQDAKGKTVGGVWVPPKGKTPCPAKPKKVNQELGILRRIMRWAKCWDEEMDELYDQLLDDEDELPRALSPEEQQRWLDVARMKPEWNAAYYYSIVAFGTCMSTDELRGLRLGDINLYQRVITVRRKTAKNKERARTIELVGADVLFALEQLIARAKELGSGDFHHYLFPWRVHIGLYDPCKPMSESGIKVPWNAIRAASGLKWFRQYDCRHTAITRLAERGVPTDIIMSAAGHVTEKMRRHYTHISQSAQRRWMEHAYQEPPRIGPQSYPFKNNSQIRKNSA